MHDHAAKSPNGPLRVGIGGPVGSGKTTLWTSSASAMRDRWSIAVDHQRHLHPGGRRVPDALPGAAARAHRRRRDRRLPAHRHPRGRLDQPRRRRRPRARFPDLDVVLIESGGDNLSATFSPELADLTLYVIDVAAGDKIPRKGGPGITRSRPARHQQDRPRPLRRRLARGDGPRLPPHARRPPLPVRAGEKRRRPSRDRRLHRNRRRPRPVAAARRLSPPPRPAPPRGAPSSAPAHPAAARSRRDA